MSYVLQSKAGGDFKPHPEGIHSAVCVDVIDLGMVESEFQGQRRLVNKVRLAFESEQKNEVNCIVTKTFTASLHPKAKLADFLGKWRGKPVVPGESIDLAKLIGANCTLVVSHQQSLQGRTYASIDAVSKPTKRLLPTGSYDPALARQRMAEWKAREAMGGQRNPQNTSPRPSPQSGEGARATDPAWVRGETAPQAAREDARPTAKAGAIEFDPEVGF
jgi:hypothetical protein